jgi:2-dehydropantoate 2-reductase
MRFVMLGAGAIGGVVGGQLAKAGLDVLFVDPLREHVDAINKHGPPPRGPRPPRPAGAGGDGRRRGLVPGR